MIMSSESTGVSPRREAIVLAVVLLLFTTFNFVTSTRFPLPWQDEDQFTDVAANFALGYGFTSTVWTCGDHDITNFFACNAPLYPYIAGLWIRHFGFTILGVRSLNYLMMTLACFFLWLAVRRLKLIHGSLSRLLLVPLIVTGYGLGINYRSGRYDCLGILLFAAILLACSIKRPSWRYSLIAVGGAVLPFAGLQLVCYAVVLSVALLVAFRTAVLREVLILGAGIALGGIAFCGFLVYHGALERFLAALHSENPTSFLQRFSDREQRIERLPKDPSLVLLYCSLLVLAIRQFREGRFRIRSPLGFGIAVGAIVPVGMILVGKFTTYYSWMAYIPLCIALLACVSELSPGRPLSTALAVLLVATGCLLGMPLQAASAIYYWGDRDMRPVEEMAARNIGPQDWVYTDYAAYFAVKRLTEHVFIPFVIPSQYRDRITVMVLAPGDYERYAHQIVRGSWYDTGDGLASSGHDLVKRSFAVLLQRRNDFKVYKRTTAAAGSTAASTPDSAARLSTIVAQYAAHACRTVFTHKLGARPLVRNYGRIPLCS